MNNIDLTALNPSDFTQTTERDPNAAAQVSIRFPSYLRFTFAWKPGMVLAVNYTHYLDPFYIKVNQNEAYLDMMDAFRLGFNFSVFQLGGGIILAKEGFSGVENGTTTNDQMWYPLPLLSIGFEVPIGKYVNTEMVVFAFPAPELKIAGSVGF